MAQYFRGAFCGTFCETFENEIGTNPNLSGAAPVA